MQTDGFSANDVPLLEQGAVATTDAETQRNVKPA
jgi:hypothetical protein